MKAFLNLLAFLVAGALSPRNYAWAHDETGGLVPPTVELSSKTYLVIIFLAALVFILSLWVLRDAKRLGLGKEAIDGNKSLGPWGWFGASITLWFLAFPLYLWARARIRPKMYRPEKG